MPRRLKILGKLKEHPMFPTAGDTFAREDVGPISTDELLTNPTWSLCCFDFESKETFFAQTPEDLDLAAAPFHYLAQYEGAIALASMPLGEFESTAETLAWPEQVVYVPNTGRCGSTLLSKAFAAVPGVLSISESDDFGQLSFALSEGTLEDETAVPIARAAMKWRGAQLYRGKRVRCLVNKPRSQATVLSKILEQAVPNLKILFMYRAADTWLRSSYNLYRAAVDMDDPKVIESMRAYWSSFDPLVEQYLRERGSLHPLALMVLNWCRNVEIYLDLYESGSLCRALRYEDLIASPRPILEQVFDFAEVRVSDWNPVLATFERDAQEGSPISRERIKAVGKPLPEEAMAAAMGIVRSRLRLGAPDVVLPGTLRP